MRTYLFPELSSDVAEPLSSIEAHGLQAPVSQHFQHLSVFCKNERGAFNLPLCPGNRTRNPDNQSKVLKLCDVRYNCTDAKPFQLKECKKTYPEKVFKMKSKMIYTSFCTLVHT